MARRATLAILKPDLAADPAIVPRVLAVAREHGLAVVAQRDLLWSRAEAERFYAEHRGKFFYPRLVNSMTR
jgi:nucleoside-diphosphate kinase